MRLRDIQTSNIPSEIVITINKKTHAMRPANTHSGGLEIHRKCHNGLTHRHSAFEHMMPRELRLHRHYQKMTNGRNPKMNEFAGLLLQIESARKENIPEDTVSGKQNMKEFNRLFAQIDL